MTAAPFVPNHDDWTGRRVHLWHKRTDERREGIIVRDPPDGTTIFAIEEGVEVSALDWYWTVVK